MLLGLVDQALLELGWCGCMGPEIRGHRRIKKRDVAGHPETVVAATAQLVDASVPLIQVVGERHGDALSDLVDGHSVVDAELHRPVAVIVECVAE